MSKFLSRDLFEGTIRQGETDLRASGKALVEDCGLKHKACECVCVCVCWWLSCGNPLSILHGGDVFSFRFKKKQKKTSFQVMTSICWPRCYFYFYLCEARFINNKQVSEWESSVNAFGKHHITLGAFLADACVLLLVWAHVCTCMPPCSPPLIRSGPLAGNLRKEIRKRNSAEECVWLSQQGIYNGL